MTVGYVTSRYPALSHTFILREVAALRRAGIEVATCSVRPAGAQDLLSAENRAEADRTYVVQGKGGAHLALRIAAAAARDPAAAAWLCRASLRRRGPGLRSAVWRLAYAAESLLVWRWAQREGVTHLHAHFANVGADLAELAAALGEHRGAGPGRWSFTMHGPTEFYDVPGHRLAEKVEAAAFVACIGAFCRSQLMAAAPPESWARLSIVRCGLQTDQIERVERADDAPPVILTTARLVPLKGIDVLLEAMVALRRAVPAARLVIAGDGPHRPALQARAAALGLAGAVEFLGAVDHARLSALHAGASVFCLPSFAEGIPVVLMEAMALGTPVVATEVMGVGELVADERTGLLVAPGDAAQLARALERLLVDAELRTRLSDAARRRVEEEFDVGVAADRLAALLAAASGDALRPMVDESTTPPAARAAVPA